MEQCNNKYDQKIDIWHADLTQKKNQIKKKKNVSVEEVDEEKDFKNSFNMLKLTKKTSDTQITEKHSS